MTPFGTYYYPPCAGTGGFLFTNPPFKMTDQPTSQPIAPGLPGLSEEEFLVMARRHGIAQTANERAQKAFFNLAQDVYRRGAGDQLEACAKWLQANGFDGLDTWLCDSMRPKPPSLKEMALAVLDDCNLDAAHENALRRALEALPE